MAGISFKGGAGATGAVGALTKFNVILGVGQELWKVLQLIGNASKGIFNAFTKHWRDVQQSAFEASRAIGLNRDQAMAYDRVLMQSTRELGRAYGVTYKEIAKWQEEYVQRTGKAIIMNRRQTEDMAAMSRLAGSDVASTMADEMNRFGGSIEDATFNVGLIQERAKAMGLSTKTASEALAKNIRLASTYQFKNGIDGLQRMLLKSQSLRVNMESIAKASDAFQDIEGAIKHSAELQMLGGSFAASFSNPMGAMYEALNDQEAFMERIRKSVAGKAVFDEKTGTARISGLDQQFIKAAANALGMDRNELTQMAMSEAKNARINADISQIGFNVNESQKALIQNKARFDTDSKKWVIDKLDESGNVTESVEVKSLTEDQLKELQDSNLTQEKLWGDVHEIKNLIRDTFGQRAMGTTSTNENLEGLSSELDSFLAQLQNVYMGTVGSWALNGEGLFGWDLFKKLGSLGGKFENGGIVDSSVLKAEQGAIIPGGSYTGDKVPVMANSGEMILSRQQQNGMWNMFKSMAAMGLGTYGTDFLGKKFGMKGLIGAGVALNALRSLMGGGGQTNTANQVTPSSSLVGARMFGSGFEKSALLASALTGGRMGMTPMGMTPMGMSPFGMSPMGMSPMMGAHVTMLNPMVTMQGGAFGANGGGDGNSISDVMESVNDLKDSLDSDDSPVKEKEKNSKSKSKYRNASGKVTKASKLRFFNKAGQRLGMPFKSLTKFSKPMQAVGSASKSVIGGIGNMSKSLMNGVGGLAKSVGKLAGPIAAVMSVADGIGTIGSAVGTYKDKLSEIDNSKMSDVEKAKAKDEAVKNKNKSIGEGIGNAAGGVIGGALGSVFGPLGTMAGAWLGSKALGAVGSLVGGLFGGDNEEKLLKDKDKFDKLNGNAVASQVSTNVIKDILSEVKDMHRLMVSKTPSNGSVHGESSLKEQYISAVNPASEIGSKTYVAPVKAPSVNAPQALAPQDININISGNIRLDSGGESVNLNALMKNPVFVDKIAKLVAERMNQYKNAGKTNREEQNAKNRI